MGVRQSRAQDNPNEKRIKDLNSRSGYWDPNIYMEPSDLKPVGQRFKTAVVVKVVVGVFFTDKKSTWKQYLFFPKCCVN